MEREPFSIYGTKNRIEIKKGDVAHSQNMRRIGCALMLIIGLIVYLQQQHQAALRENIELKNKIIEQQQLIESTPDPYQTAVDLIKAMSQQAGPPDNINTVVQVKPKKEPVKPLMIKRNKTRRISQIEQAVSDGYGTRN